MTTLITSLVIGFLALDTTIAFQVLVSQPIFACSIIGAILGDVATGVEIGMMMQLLWLNIVPVGATVFPEGNIGSMVTCALVIQLDYLNIPHTVFTAAFINGLLVSYLGARLTVLDRKLNGYILDLTLKAVEYGSFKRIMLLDIFSICAYFLMMSVLAYLALLLGEMLIPMLKEANLHSLEKILTFIKPAVWGIGIALSLQMIYQVWKQKISN